MGVITSESRSTIERMERRLSLQKEASDRLIAALTRAVEMWLLSERSRGRRGAELREQAKTYSQKVLA